MKPAVDRRLFVRHKPMKYDTYLQIMDWNGAWVTNARLLNVSIGGAFIVTHLVSAPGQKLHARLLSASEIGWIDAQVVHLGRDRGAGIRFRSRCSSEFLHAALRGGNPQFEYAGDEETLMIGNRNRELDVV
jgi:PilZ domain